MERLEGSLRRELERFGGTREGADEAAVDAIVRAWPTVVGETVVRNAWPARLSREGTLHVNASSSTWAFELGRLAETILEQLRAALGNAAPTAVRFAPGPLPEPPAEPPATTLPVGPGDRAEAAELTAAIADDELRELVARAAAASLARARSDLRF